MIHRALPPRPSQSLHQIQMRYFNLISAHFVCYWPSPVLAYSLHISSPRQTSQQFVSGSFHLTPEHRTLNNQNSLRTTERREANFLLSPHRQLRQRRQKESFFAIIKFFALGRHQRTDDDFATQSRPFFSSLVKWFEKTKYFSFRWAKKRTEVNLQFALTMRFGVLLDINWLGIYLRWIIHIELRKMKKLFLKKIFWKRKFPYNLKFHFS